MNRLIDKIIIFALSLFAMNSILRGTAFLVCVYVAIMISALNYYLIRGERSDFLMKPDSGGEWCAFFLEIIVAAVAALSLLGVGGWLCYDNAQLLQRSWLDNGIQQTFFQNS